MNWAMKIKSYSQRKACELVGIAPRVYCYQSTRSDDTELRKRLVELSAERRRFGYRRLHILLKREGGFKLEEAIQALQGGKADSAQTWRW